MDRCAVFVDAGYLHESAKTLMLGGHPGATVRANAVTLVREIAELAVAQTQLPLLRIYWYAAAPNRNPYPDQRELASLGDIKLRLGNLRERAGGKMVQKGVDAELHADMTGLARNRGAVDFVLLSGDEDLLRAVDEVQSYGVRVHLWGVEAGPDGGNQSLELIAACDRRHVLEEAWIRNVFNILEPPKPDSPMARPPIGVPAGAGASGLPAPSAPGGGPSLESAAGGPAEDRTRTLPSPISVGPVPRPAVPKPGVPVSPAAAAAGRDTGALAAQPPAGGAVGPAAPVGIASTPLGPAAAPAGAAGGQPAAPPGTGSPEAVDVRSAAPQARPMPKPTDLRPRPGASTRNGDTLLYTTSAGHTGYYPVPDYAFYRLSDLTTQAEQYEDAAEDARTAFDAISVGRTYARRWLSRATSEAAAMLALEYPAIPRTIDAELLRYAVARGVDTWTSETDKFAVRQAFWAGVRLAGSATLSTETHE